MANPDQAETAKKLAVEVPASTPDQELAARKRAAAYAEAAGVTEAAEVRDVAPKGRKSARTAAETA